MDAIFDSAAALLEGFLKTLELLVLSGVGAFILGSAGCCDADLAGPVPARLRHRLHRGAAQHPAAARAVLLRVRAAVSSGPSSTTSRSPSSASPRTPPRSSPRRSAPGFNGVPVGQAEAARSIGLGSARRHARGAAASDPDGGSAADQRLHRPDQEHFRGRRLLRRRTLRRHQSGHQGPRRRRHPVAALRRGAATW